MECWNCKEKGHFRNQCPNEKKQVNAAVDDIYYDDALILSVESSVDSWVMDSGASVHATCDNPYISVNLNRQIEVRQPVNFKY